MNQRLQRILTALAVALGGPTAASAAILVNDTWQDAERASPASPTYSESGADGDADGDLESAWFNGGASAMSVSAGTLSKDLTGTSANWTTYFTAEGSEVNLANSGDKLRVTWSFIPRVVNNNANTSQDLRIGLVNTPAAGRLAVEGAPVADLHTGYAVFANMGQTLGNSNPFQLRERIANTLTNNILGTSGNWGALGNGATSGNDGYDSNETYSLVWELTRNGAGIDVSATMSGTGFNGTGSATVFVNDPDGNGFVFDTFNVRPSSTANTADIFDTKLFRVEFIPIPEPSSLALLGLAGLASWGARGRR